jgi:hypothetical protein
MTKLFKIEEYDLTAKFITVTTEDEQVIEIEREKFEKWLEDSGRLEYTFTMPDHTGEPKEVEGIMSVNSYWGEWDADNDLYDYIILHNMVDPFAINEPLNNILSDFSQE